MTVYRFGVDPSEIYDVTWKPWIGCRNVMFYMTGVQEVKWDSMHWEGIHRLQKKNKYGVKVLAWQPLEFSWDNGI